MKKVLAMLVAGALASGVAAYVTATAGPTTSAKIDAVRTIK